MKPRRITPETMPMIISELKMACDSPKDFEVSIIAHDSSLKARQRALCKIWYKDVGEAQGITAGAAEAFCKLMYGFKIRCERDPDLEKIIRKMLDGYDYEQKLAIIEIYPEWFPVLRDKSGMNSEQIGRYLRDIQQGFGQEGVFLSSPNERELLNCRGANI